jgi:hypothetical protein
MQVYTTQEKLMTAPYSEEAPVEASPPPLPPPQEEKRRASASAVFLAFGSAFWTIASIISLTVNVILIVVLIYLGSQFSNIKKMVRDDVLAGLYTNFALMDQASIKTTIPIHTEVPAKFNLPLDTDTVVVLSKDTRIPGATVTLNTGGLTIVNAPTDIILPAGTRLPIHLTLEVPVDQQIPVDLSVDVNIPLNKTDLHQPFVGLQNLVAPYYVMVNNMPESWSQMLCGMPTNPLCKEIIP